MQRRTFSWSWGFLSRLFLSPDSKPSSMSHRYSPGSSGSATRSRRPWRTFPVTQPLNHDQYRCPRESCKWTQTHQWRQDHPPRSPYSTHCDFSLVFRFLLHWNYAHLGRREPSEHHQSPFLKIYYTYNAQTQVIFVNLDTVFLTLSSLTTGALWQGGLCEEISKNVWNMVRTTERVICRGWKCVFCVRKESSTYEESIISLTNSIRHLD